jgi:hypothetical protein
MSRTWTKIIKAITCLFIFFFTKKEHISDKTWPQSLKYISRGSQMPPITDIPNNTEVNKIFSVGYQT